MSASSALCLLCVAERVVHERLVEHAPHGRWARREKREGIFGPSLEQERRDE